MLVSGEVIKPFNIRNNIVIEPQAQLIYQKLKMKDFTDGYRKVSQGNGSNIRARIGTKISYEDNSQRTYYARINLWQNLINTSKTHIGKDVLEEKYGKNSMDIGLGVKMPIFKRGNIYGDIIYNKSLGNGKNDTAKATIGIDYQF